ncbi:hypothetical protein CCR75_005589 [Bremia lactucae]|uniref:Uncharacterized protein n=1 Tax=Bremia lactucae TaxID=4779 RepID=A0A976NZN4_BRELC|nr:hypothetical protein CCR75_005589 [Bremia lactucae]
MRRLSDDDKNDNVCKIISKDPKAFYGALKEGEFGLHDRTRMLTDLISIVSIWMPAAFRPLPSEFFEEAEVLSYD